MTEPLFPPERSEAARTDAAWKEVLTLFFQDFIAFFFPYIESEIDWVRGYTFLDKELEQVARGYATGKRVVDKLAQVYLKDGGERWLLLHVEIEGRPKQIFNERMYTYNYRLFDRDRVTVVSLGVVLKPGYLPLGKYEREQWGCRVTFEFPVVRLSEYANRLEELEQSQNPVAIVVLAQLKALESGKDNIRKFAFKRHLVQLLYERGWNRQQVIEMFRVIDYLVMLPHELDEQLHQEIHEYKEKKVMLISSLEVFAIKKGLEKGLKKGRKEGRKEGLKKGLEKGKEEALSSLVLRLLTRKLGKLSGRSQTRLRRLSARQLDELGEALLEFTATKDLQNWLNQHPPENGKSLPASSSENAPDQENASPDSEKQAIAPSSKRKRRSTDK